MGGFDHLEFNTAPTEAIHTPTPRTHSEKARALRRAGYFEKALPVYRQAIGMNDHNYDAWTEYIDTLVRVNHLDEADTVSKPPCRIIGVYINSTLHVRWCFRIRGISIMPNRMCRQP